MSNSEEILSNNADLQRILNTVKNLPNASEGGSEDLSAEIEKYASLNTDLETVINSLPAAGFTPVQYCAFTGEQIIDTGIICTNNTKIRVLFTRDSSNAMYMYGVVNSGNTASVTAYLTSSTGAWRFGAKSANKAVTVSEDLVQTALVDSTGVDFANNSTAISGVTAFTTIGSLLIGACRSAEGEVGSAQFIGKILLFEMKEGDTEVLNLIPVVTADGEYCFYDTVSEQFFKSITETPLSGGNL